PQGRAPSPPLTFGAISPTMRRAPCAARLPDRPGDRDPPRGSGVRDRPGRLRDGVPPGGSLNMASNRERLAQLLGARVVGQVPAVGGGVFGMAQLGHLLHERLTPSQGERPGRPTDASWVVRPKVPMSKATQAELKKLAERVSTPERKVSAMQVAACPLEEAGARVQQVG